MSFLYIGLVASKRIDTEGRSKLTDKMVLTMLADTCDDKGRCRVRLSYLADKCGGSEDAVRKSIHRLAA